MPGRLTGEVAIITGGARGQGAAEAALFANEGAKVLIGDVLDELGEQIAETLGPNVAYRHLDVALPTDWAGAVEQAEARFGPVTALVNNAGILRVASILDTTPASFMEHVEVNQLGVFLGIQAVAPAMIEAGRGAIVNVSSAGGFKGAPGHVAYCATKFAVRGITHVAAIELSPHGIRVNSIHPGMIDTSMIAGLPKSMTEDFARRTPLGRRGDPAEIANAVLFLVSSDSSYMTGAELVVDGGVLA